MNENLKGIILNYGQEGTIGDWSGNTSFRAKSNPFHSGIY